MTKSEALITASQLTSVAIQAMMAAQQAQNILQKAHEEGWTDDDERWASAFKAADDALAQAIDRL